MIQDVSNRQSKPNPKISPTAIQPWSFDSKAHELMDEVFSEIESLIENGGKLPTQTIQPTSPSLEHSDEDVFALTQTPQEDNISEIPPLAPLDSQSVSPSSQITKAVSTDIIPLDTSESELTAPEETEVFTPILERNHNSSQYLDKILLVIAFSSLLAVTWWLASQGKLQFAFLQNFKGESVPIPEETVQSNTQFIEYMQRSLKVLDQQQQEAKEEEKIASTPPGSVFPVPPNPSTTEETTPATILQPIYIPFYPPNQIPSHGGNFSVTTPPPPTTVAKLPPPPAATTPPPQTPPPLPPQKTSRAPSPPPTASAPVKIAVTPVEKGVKNTPTTIENTPSVTPLAETQHTLNGLLEDGERSAALFDLNGITQRVKLGEEIGASGWTLVEVANQKALIRRNGEVRAIYAGQKF